MSTVEEITEVPPGAVMVHEPHGFVRLVDSNADDLRVVNAARVSFRKQSDWEEPPYTVDTGAIGPVDHPGQLSEGDARLVRFLLRGKHGTPFEHTFFQFHVRAPIFVFREWHRHRIGISINEESARYVPLKPDFYLPDDEHVRVQKGKPGAYTFEPMGDAAILPEVDAYRAGMSYGDFTRRKLEAAYTATYETYEHLMRMGIAKEIARACLPVGIYSQMYWTCNARSLMAFLALRNAPTALREIRDYAQAMEDIFARAMPVTHQAFVENGRVAP